MPRIRSSRNVRNVRTVRSTPRKNSSVRGGTSPQEQQKLLEQYRFMTSKPDQTEGKECTFSRDCHPGPFYCSKKQGNQYGSCTLQGGPGDKCDEPEHCLGNYCGKDKKCVISYAEKIREQIRSGDIINYDQLIDPSKLSYKHELIDDSRLFSEYEGNKCDKSFPDSDLYCQENKYRKFKFHKETCDDKDLCHPSFVCHKNTCITQNELDLSRYADILAKKEAENKAAIASFNASQSASFNDSKSAIRGGSYFLSSRDRKDMRSHIENKYPFGKFCSNDTDQTVDDTRCKVKTSPVKNVENQFFYCNKDLFNNNAPLDKFGVCDAKKRIGEPCTSSRECFSGLSCAQNSKEPKNELTGLYPKYCFAVVVDADGKPSISDKVGKECDSKNTCGLDYFYCAKDPQKSTLFKTVGTCKIRNFEGEDCDQNEACVPGTVCKDKKCMSYELLQRNEHLKAFDKEDQRIDDAEQEFFKRYDNLKPSCYKEFLKMDRSTKERKDYANKTYDECVSQKQSKFYKDIEEENLRQKENLNKLNLKYF